MDTDQKELDELAGVIANWRAAKTKAAEWKTAADELSAVIVTALGDAEIGTVDGKPIVSYKRFKKTALSQKLLKQLHPDVFAECTETTESSSGLRLVEG